MPRVKWGDISAADVDDFDRDSQFKPYAGPTPPDGVYAWRIKVFKFSAGGKGKFDQLRPGLELVPRAGFNEAKYAGYFTMDFIPVSGKTQFRYVPFLDAIGVSGREFETATIIDEDGNVKKIGKWRNNSDTVIIAQLRSKKEEDEDGKEIIRKEIASYGELPEDIELAEDDTELPDDDDMSEDVIDEDYEEEERPRGRTRTGRKRPTVSTRKTSVRKRTSARRGSATRTARRKPRDDDYVDEDGF